MNIRIRRPSTATIMLIAMSLLVVFAGLVYIFANNTVKAESVSSGRLITVHDRGVETVFLTDKATIQEALTEAGILVDSRDAVEPGLDETLVARDYQVNIYRARPVTVVDGATRQRVITPYQTAERIASDAGIVLFAEDKTTFSQSNDIIANGAGLQLTIDRATVLTFDLFGKKTEVRTQGETVQQLLEEKSIILTADDRVSPSVSTPISAGLEVRVWREGKQTISVDEEVAFGVEQVQDADRATGYKEVQTVGVNGKRTVTYEIEIVNGAEVNRTEIASIEITPATKQVEVIGTKPNYLPYTGGGTKTDWLAASNIPSEYWGYADFMVQKESTWRPDAVNKSSGACGLAQALPCSKLGPEWNNPVVALNWMNNYVNGRYGGWEQAYNFWLKNRWY